MDAEEADEWRRRIGAWRRVLPICGYMRHLKPKQKARVRSVREKKGIQAAVKLAKKLV
jgi:hypothetical protein